jgi:hypothetical protein
MLIVPGHCRLIRYPSWYTCVCVNKLNMYMYVCMINDAQNSSLISAVLLQLADSSDDTHGPIQNISYALVSPKQG